MRRSRSQRAKDAHNNERARKAAEQLAAARSFQESPQATELKSGMSDALDDWAARLEFELYDVHIGYTDIIQLYEVGRSGHPHATASFDGVSGDIDAHFTATYWPDGNMVVYINGCENIIITDEVSLGEALDWVDSFGGPSRSYHKKKRRRR